MELIQNNTWNLGDFIFLAIILFCTVLIFYFMKIFVGPPDSKKNQKQKKQEKKQDNQKVWTKGRDSLRNYKKGDGSIIYYDEES